MGLTEVAATLAIVLGGVLVVGGGIATYEQHRLIEQGLNPPRLVSRCVKTAKVMYIPTTNPKTCQEHEFRCVPAGVNYEGPLTCEGLLEAEINSRFK